MRFLFIVASLLLLIQPLDGDTSFGSGGISTELTNEPENLSIKDLEKELELAQNKANATKKLWDEARNELKKKENEAARLNKDYEKKKKEFERLDGIAKELVNASEDLASITQRIMEVQFTIRGINKRPDRLADANRKLRTMDPIADDPVERHRLVDAIKAIEKEIERIEGVIDGMDETEESCTEPYDAQCTANINLLSGYRAAVKKANTIDLPAANKKLEEYDKIVNEYPNLVKKINKLQKSVDTMEEDLKIAEDAESTLNDSKTKADERVKKANEAQSHETKTVDIALSESVLAEEAKKKSDKEVDEQNIIVQEKQKDFNEANGKAEAMKSRYDKKKRSEEKPKAAGFPLWIIGVVMVVILAVGALIAVFLFRRRKKNQNQKNEQKTDQQGSVANPTSISTSKTAEKVDGNDYKNVPRHPNEADATNLAGPIEDVKIDRSSPEIPEKVKKLLSEYAKPNTDVRRLKWKNGWTEYYYTCTCNLDGKSDSEGNSRCDFGRKHFTFMGNITMKTEHPIDEFDHANKFELMTPSPKLTKIVFNTKLIKGFNYGEGSDQFVDVRGEKESEPAIEKNRIVNGSKSYERSKETDKAKTRMNAGGGKDHSGSRSRSETGPKPNESRKRNDETGSKPDESRKRNDETGSKPDESRKRNDETGSKPDESRKRNDETGSKPDESRKRNDETGMRDRDSSNNWVECLEMFDIKLDKHISDLSRSKYTRVGGEKVVVPLQTPLKTCLELSYIFVELVCERVQAILKEEPQVMEISHPVAIVGDIHGQYEMLHRIFSTFAERGRPGWTQIRFLFLGDYVDRGDKCLEVFMFLFLLKIKNPKSFAILRGNHETKHINSRFGFRKEIMERFAEHGEEKVEYVYKLINDVFDFFSVGCLIYFIVLPIETLVRITEELNWKHCKNMESLLSSVHISHKNMTVFSSIGTTKFKNMPNIVGVAYINVDDEMGINLLSPGTSEMRKRYPEEKEDFISRIEMANDANICHKFVVPDNQTGKVGPEDPDIHNSMWNRESRYATLISLIDIIEMLPLIVACVSIAIAIYVYYVHDSQYWTRRGITQVPGKLFLGVCQQVLKRSEPRLLVLKEWTKKYGKTYGFKEGAKNVLVTSDIDIINEVFVKQFDNFYGRVTAILGADPDKDQQVHLFLSRGPRWKRLRALSVPTFSISSLKKVRHIVEDSATSMVEIMERRHGDGSTCNIHDFFCEFTMDVIARLVLGQKEAMLFNNSRIDVVKGMMLRETDNPILHAAYAFPFLVPAIKWVIYRLDTSLSRSARKMRFDIMETVGKRIKERKSSPEMVGHPNDMLDMFLDASDDSDEIESHDGFKLSQSKTSKTLSVDEVVMQVIIFILAGFDTTSNALAYTAWMLANHPEVMKKCQEEIDECCRNESISYEDLANLKYVEATCKETLRLIPMGSISNSRTCMNSTNVCGIDIEEGTWIEADIYSLHVDKEVWGEDADEFKPERWLDPFFHVPSHAYGAFGGGPRICIGMRLGMMEEKMALAHLLRKWSIVKADPQQKELRMHGAIIVTPIEVPVRIVPRY